MPTAKLLLIAALALLAAACGQAAALDGLADAGPAEAVAVEGGTVVLADGRRASLAGVVLPEPGAPFAAEARANLEQLIEGGEVRLLSGGGAEGPFHLRTDRRTWIQGALLQAGAARVRTAPDDRALASEMLRLEASARAANRGLWASPVYQVRLPTEVVSGRQSGFLVVEGRVLRAAENAGRLYLEFSPDWRGGFSAEIALGALPSFAAAGVDPRSLQGRLVRLRGEVRPTAYGPRLRLDHPEQVERLSESP